jgi:hypothetical protein
MASQAINGISGRCVVEFVQINSNGTVAKGIPDRFFDDDQIIHVSTTIEACINKPKMCVHVMQAKSPAYVNDTLIPNLLSSIPVLAMRFGITAGGSQKWLPYERHVILNDTIQVLPDAVNGPKVSFKTADWLWFFGYGHVRAHKGSISAIALHIWDLLGGNQNVNGGNQLNTAPNAVVEDCLAPGRGNTTDTAGVYYQSAETDLDFLSTKLLPRAFSTEGKAGYRFFVLDDALHFHTPGYNQPVAKLISYSGNAPLAENLMVSDKSVEYAQKGGTGVVAYTHDPLTGFSQPLVSDPLDVAIFANTRGQYGSTPAQNGQQSLNVAVTYAMSHIGQNLAIDEKTKIQHKYANYRTESYSATLSLKSNIDVHLGDIVDLYVAGSAGKRNAYSSYWEVQKIVYAIDLGVLTTHLTLGRGELLVNQDKVALDPNTGASTADTSPTTNLKPNIAPVYNNGVVSIDLPSNLTNGVTVTVSDNN